MKYYVDVCEKCKKAVIKESLSDSSDMIRADGTFLYFCDIQDSSPARPHLYFKDQMYCPECFFVLISEWINEISKIPKSKTKYQIQIKNEF